MSQHVDKPMAPSSPSSVTIGVAESATVAATIAIITTSTVVTTINFAPLLSLSTATSSPFCVSRVSPCNGTEDIMPRPKKGVLKTEKSNPLEDIEKFIEAGVNLLKSDYRLNGEDAIEPESLNSTDIQHPAKVLSPTIHNNDNQMQCDNNEEDTRQERKLSETSGAQNESNARFPDQDATSIDITATTTSTISKMMNDFNLSDKTTAFKESTIPDLDTESGSLLSEKNSFSSMTINDVEVYSLPSTDKITDDDIIMKEVDEVTSSSSILSNNSSNVSIVNTASTISGARTVSTESPNSNTTSSTLTCTTIVDTGVRRSHRLKKINKGSKAVVGRGLVRDRERFVIKDDENRNQYSIDDHLMDLAEVDAKNAKFLKEMEERLSNFHVIKENEYKCERIISREARKMICDCFLTVDEEDRGEFGCGEDCLNRLLMIECGPDCNVKDRCTNKRFQKYLYSPCRVFRTEKKGFGIMADSEIHPAEFIMEYIGEVIDSDEFERRRINYSHDKNRHYYFMALRSDMIIDATRKGNISRFINHSCDPNAETQKWTVNGELRIGFFSRKFIMPGEEITFDYQYQRYGREAQRCYCESSNCRGWIGQEPASDEGEQQHSDSNDDDDDDEEDEDDDDDEDDENETVDARNLLVADDDFGSDSDDMINDPAVVQRKLEMAAAVELDLDMNLSEKSQRTSTTRREKGRSKKSVLTTEPSIDDCQEDSNLKLQRLLSKVAEKVVARQQQNKQKQQQQKRRRGRKRTSLHSSSLKNAQRLLDDPDIENEVEFLKHCGVKNQSDTLRLSRLMVRAKILSTRLNLLEILKMGELPCRRLFLDYHGLRLLHGWMSEDQTNLQVRYAVLQTLKTLPIVNKTILNDSKVIEVVRQWAEKKDLYAQAEIQLSEENSGNQESSQSSNNTSLLKDDSKSTGDKCEAEDKKTGPLAEKGEVNLDCFKVQQLAVELLSAWEVLPEIFRIPKKERIEQMKEHEREADRQYAETTKDDKIDINSVDCYQRDRFGRNYSTISTLTSANRYTKYSQQQQQSQNGFKYIGRSTMLRHINRKNLTKKEYRELFAAQVAREEAYKRNIEERKEHEVKCRFFGLNPKKTKPEDMPFCVDPSTSQWYTKDSRPIPTPPSYAYAQVARRPQSTDPNDYQLPEFITNLPPHWKYAITPMGTIYYYHVEKRVPQWEPPTPAQIRNAGSGDDESESDIDEDELFLNFDKMKLNEYIDKVVQSKRQKRNMNLVDERSISPRKEEDRIYNQIEVRKYKENKEKIRKRKEELRRKRLENPQQNNGNDCENNVTITTQEGHDTNVIADDNNSGLREIEMKEEEVNSEKPCVVLISTSPTLISVKEENDKDLINALPIQDYLLSSEEDEKEADKDVDNGEIADDNKETVKVENEKHKTTNDSRNENKNDLDTNEDDDEDENDMVPENDALFAKISANGRIVDELDALRKKTPSSKVFLLKSQRASKEQQQTSLNQQVPGSSQLQNDSNLKVIQNSSTNNDKQQQQQQQQDSRKRKLEKKDKKKAKDDKESRIRKLREKFRCEIAGIIVHYLKPYRKDSCKIGRIQSNEDFNHLARKLTHFVMIKELKYCESVGQTLVVTESVKNKSREFIRRYMTKYEDVYLKPENDPEFKEIPYSL